MSSAENGRLCWLTDDWREGLERWLPADGRNRYLQAAAVAFDAAPADPVVAVIEALDECAPGVMGGASCVLAALGVPAPPQRPTPRDETEGVLDALADDQRPQGDACGWCDYGVGPCTCTSKGNPQDDEQGKT